jgi:hypothetical protein
MFNGLRKYLPARYFHLFLQNQLIIYMRVYGQCNRVVQNSEICVNSGFKLLNRVHPAVFMLYNKIHLKCGQTQLIIEVYEQLVTYRATTRSFGYLYNHHQPHTKGHLAMS